MNERTRLKLELASRVHASMLTRMGNDVFEATDPRAQSEAYSFATRAWMHADVLLKLADEESGVVTYDKGYVKLLKQAKEDLSGMRDHIKQLESERDELREQVLSLEMDVSGKHDTLSVSQDNMYRTDAALKSSIAENKGIRSELELTRAENQELRAKLESAPKILQLKEHCNMYAVPDTIAGASMPPWFTTSFDAASRYAHSCGKAVYLVRLEKFDG